MELEYKDNRRRAGFIIVIGLVLAVVAGGAAFFLMNQAAQQAASGDAQTVSLVVAARAIPARKPIEADDLAVRPVPVDGTNAQGVVTNPDELVGKVLAVTLLEGQLVTTNLLASTITGSDFAILDPTETVAEDSEAWRAVSITVPDERAVGGTLQPGQTVDVFVTATVNVPQDLLEEGTFYTDKSTKLTYQNMLILSRQGTFYILKASLPVAEEISHLQASGTAGFSLVLRPDIDTRIIDTGKLGETTNLIITRYGLPIPETYPAGKGPIATAPPIEDNPRPVPSPSGSPTTAVPEPSATTTP